MRLRSVSTWTQLFGKSRNRSVGQTTNSGTTGLSGATKVVAGLWIALFVAGLILATAPASIAAPAQFKLVGTHPQAAIQTTAAGKTISTLKVHQGRIYAGFGDQNANTGPIAITPFDPVSASFAGLPVHMADTEAIQIYREINGRLFAPSSDSKTGSDYAVSTDASGSGAWENGSGLGSTHIYDVVTMTGSDLWMVGSQGGNAVVWHSLDGGTSWQQSLSIAARNSGEWARFYFAGELNGRLYVQAEDSGSGLQPSSMVYDGQGWSHGPVVLPFLGGWGHHTENFAGKMIFQTYPGGWSDLWAFDGMSTTKVALGTQIRDYTIANSKIYVLTMENTVLSSTNLTDWQSVVTAPRSSTSIAVINSDVYVGTSTSALYRYTIPAEGSTTPKGSRCRPKRCTSTTTTNN